MTAANSGRSGNVIFGSSNANNFGVGRPLEAEYRVSVPTDGSVVTDYLFHVFPVGVTMTFRTFQIAGDSTGWSIFFYDAFAGLIADTNFEFFVTKVA